MTYAALCKNLDALYASGERSQLFDLVRRLALRRLRDEDAAQEVAIAAWQRIAAHKPRAASFAAWINLLVNDRRRGVVQELARQSRCEQVGELVCYDDNRPAPDVVFPNAKAERVFSMKAEGYSTREIAAAVGMTPGALDVACTRWRKQIQVAC